jgi:hypothetical protein
MEYAKRFMSMRLGNARYSAKSGRPLRAERPDRCA